MKARIDDAGFLPFVTLLVDSLSDRMVIHALAERWWDSTNTFHLPFGEMTMTPLDFHVITGLRYGVVPLSTEKDLCTNLDEVEGLLGVRPTVVLSGHVKVSWIYSTFHGRNDLPVDCLARAFLLYVIGSTILCTKNERVSLHHLENLRNLDLVYRVDWAGAAYATLLRNMGAFSRGVTSSMVGFWRAWEVWHSPLSFFVCP